MPSIDQGGCMLYFIILVLTACSGGQGTRLLTPTAELLCLALKRRKGKSIVATHWLRHPGLNWKLTQFSCSLIQFLQLSAMLFTPCNVSCEVITASKEAERSVTCFTKPLSNQHKQNHLRASLQQKQACMRIWDQGQPDLLAGTGRGKGIKSNDEPTEELHGWEGLGTKQGFWGGSASPAVAASTYMLTPSQQQLAFQGPGTGKAAGPQHFCYGKAISFSTQLFCLSRGSPFTP